MESITVIVLKCDYIDIKYIMLLSQNFIVFRQQIWILVAFKP